MVLSEETVRHFLMAKKQFDNVSKDCNEIVTALLEQVRKDWPDVTVWELIEALETFTIGEEQ